MNVLLVDDNVSDVKGLTELLTEKGFDVRSMLSGVDAIGALASEAWKPDVMVLDYLMPGLDGGDVLDAMRVMRTLRRVPIIILSAYDVPEHVAEQADAVLKKPLDLRMLVKEIGRLVKTGTSDREP